MRLENIPIDLIDPPHHQHRLDYDEAAMDQLMSSIRDQGLLNPILVRRDGERYETIAGDRRREAHRRLGRQWIAAFIADGEEGRKIESMRFAENLQRSDLTPIEEALAIDRARREQNLSIADLARELNRSRDWIERRLDLLALPVELAEALHARQVPTGAALELARVDDAEHRRYLLTYAMQQGASVPVLRAWVNEWLLHQENAGDTPPPRPDLQAPAAPPIILMECAACGAQHPHTELMIVRVCRPCHDVINDEKGGA